MYTKNQFNQNHSPNHINKKQKKQKASTLLKLLNIDSQKSQSKIKKKSNLDFIKNQTFRINYSSINNKLEAQVNDQNQKIKIVYIPIDISKLQIKSSNSINQKNYISKKKHQQQFNKMKQYDSKINKDIQISTEQYNQKQQSNQYMPNIQQRQNTPIKNIKNQTTKNLKPKFQLNNQYMSSKQYQYNYKNQFECSQKKIENERSKKSFKLSPSINNSCIKSNKTNNYFTYDIQNKQIKTKNDKQYQIYDFKERQFFQQKSNLKNSQKIIPKDKQNQYNTFFNKKRERIQIDKRQKRNKIFQQKIRQQSVYKSTHKINPTKLGDQLNLSRKSKFEQQKICQKKRDINGIDLKSETKNSSIVTKSRMTQLNRNNIEIQKGAIQVNNKKVEQKSRTPFKINLNGNLRQSIQTNLKVTPIRARFKQKKQQQARQYNILEEVNDNYKSKLRNRMNSNVDYESKQVGTNDCFTQFMAQFCN